MPKTTWQGLPDPTTIITSFADYLQLFPEGQQQTERQTAIQGHITDLLKQIKIYDNQIENQADYPSQIDTLRRILRAASFAVDTISQELNELPQSRFNRHKEKQNILEMLKTTLAEYGQRAHSKRKYTEALHDHQRINRLEDLFGQFVEVTSDGVVMRGLDHIYGLEAQDPTHSAWAIDAFQNTRELKNAWLKEAREDETTPDFIDWLALHPERTRDITQVHQVDYDKSHHREGKRLIFTDGKIFQNTSSEAKPLHNTGGQEWAFVMIADPDTHRADSPHIFAMEHVPGEVHHSTPNAGKPVLTAGMIQIDTGIVTAIHNKSGHYKPNLAEFLRVLHYLHSQGVLAPDCKISCHDPIRHEASTDINPYLRGQPIYDKENKFAIQGTVKLSGTGYDDFMAQAQARLDHYKIPAEEKALIEQRLSASTQYFAARTIQRAYRAHHERRQGMSCTTSAADMSANGTSYQKRRNSDSTQKVLQTLQRNILTFCNFDNRCSATVKVEFNLNGHWQTYTIPRFAKDILTIMEDNKGQHDQALLKVKDALDELKEAGTYSRGKGLIKCQLNDDEKGLVDSLKSLCDSRVEQIMVRYQALGNGCR